MKYFENEELITASENNRVVLTNRRIRQTENGTDFTSIMLEKISSVQVKYQSWIFILLAGILLIAGGAVAALGGNNEGVFAALIGLVCIGVYFLTRKHIVSVSSDGGAKILFTTRGMNKDHVKDFVDKLEEAKSKLTTLNTNN